MKTTQTLTHTTPLDSPNDREQFRIYAALTNCCNRSCPWCSACSSPKGNTYLSVEDLTHHIPNDKHFEVQLEGGEPTIHPQFFDFVRLLRGTRLCTRIVLVTNGVTLPRDEPSFQQWATELGAPLTLKLSVNHYLLDRDSGLLQLACLIRDVFDALGGDRKLVLNVRLRREVEEDWTRIVGQLEQLNLLTISNVFYLQRYGFADNNDSWDEPFTVNDNFVLLNPDGKAYGTDIMARSAALKLLSH